MLSAVFVHIPRVESHPVSFRAEDKATAHNRVVSGSENPHPWAAANQALGDVVATGVLGKPAIALCAVPLLIPVSSLIWAHERPRCLRNTILSASTSACSAELRITIRLYLDRMMGLSKIY